MRKEDVSFIRKGEGKELVFLHGYLSSKEAFLPLIDRYQPRYLVHGHVHTEYGRDVARVLHRGKTTIINACERYALEV